MDGQLTNMAGNICICIVVASCIVRLRLRVLCRAVCARYCVLIASDETIENEIDEFMGFLCSENGCSFPSLSVVPSFPSELLKYLLLPSELLVPSLCFALLLPSALRYSFSPTSFEHRAFQSSGPGRACRPEYQLLVEYLVKRND
jgi:hypothetical protein